MKKLIYIVLLIGFVSESCSSQVDTTQREVHQFQIMPNFLVKEDLNERVPLYISKDFGQTWSNASYNLPKDIEVSFIENKGNELVIATDNKGVFLSEKNKTEWKAIGQKLPDLKINALFVNEQAIFVGVYQKGIYKTMDNGENWQSLNFNLPNKRIQAIISTNELIVGTDEGIFKLNPKQNNWIKVSESVQVLSLKIYKNKLIAGTNKGTLFSEDKGETWKWIHQKGAIHYTHWVEGSIVEMHLSGDIIISKDDGNTWSFIQYQPRKGSYVYEVVELKDYWIMSNNYGIHRSIDSGKNWKLIYPIEEIGFFDFWVENNVIYGGTRSWDEYRKRD